MVVISGLVLLLLFWFSLLLPLQAWRSWRAPWRHIALLPLLLPLGFIVKTVVGILSEPPVYSISPLVAFAVALGALALYGLILLAYKRRRLD